MSLNNKRIVFHGTTDLNFKNFSDDKIGLGGDPNSVLGIFFAEDPYLAAEHYAENGLVVVAVIKDKFSVVEDLEHHIFNDEILARVNKVYMEDGCEPFEYPPNFDQTDDYKVFCYYAREYYLEKGIQCLQYAHIGDDQQMCIALNSKDIEILCTLKPEQAFELSERIGQLDDFYDQEKRFKLLQEYLISDKILVRDKNDLKVLIENEIKVNGINCDLNHLDVSQVTDISSLFYMSKFNGNISQWDVSNVVDMNSMFLSSSFNGDISKWNVSKVIDMAGMFLNSSFNQDLTAWKPLALTQKDEMFDNYHFAKTYWYNTEDTPKAVQSYEISEKLNNDLVKKSPETLVKIKI